MAMDALLTAIVLWLSANYDLPATFDHPRVVHVAPGEMWIVRSKHALSGASELAALDGQMVPAKKMREVVAVYDDFSNTVYLPDGWSDRSAADLSILVHEMVHHLQNKAELHYDCAAEREKLAYDAQDKWLRLFGGSLEDDFEINGLALLISTSCEMALGIH